MMNSGSSSSEQAFDWSFEPDNDWENLVNELNVDEFPELVVNFGVDAAIANQNYPNETIISTRNSNTGLIGGAADTSQNGTPQNMMTLSSLTPTNSTATVLSTSGHILPPIPKFASNSVSQSSQSSKPADFSKHHAVQPTQAHQNQRLLQQAFNHKAVQQQPLTHSPANQSGVVTVDDHNNKLIHYQMQSDQLVRCTSPVLNTQTRNLQNNQASRLQNQQSPNQKPLQFQQGTSKNSIPGGRQQGNNSNIELTAPVGFSSPYEFPSSDAWREYVLRQIPSMKERYLNELLTMHNDVMLLRIQATTMDSVQKYDHVREQLERMITFLHVSRVGSIPKKDERVYNFLNFIVNYVNYHRRSKSTAGSSQRHEAVHQPPKGPAMQPSGAMNLQYNQPPNSSRGVENQEANMVNFNQNFPSRGPQPQQARMTSSLNNASFQMGSIQQNPANPLQTGLFKGPQPSVLNTTQQTSSGPRTRAVNRPGRSPISLFSNTTATNFPSRPLNYHPPLTNQNLNSEKLKQPMHITSTELNQSKMGLGVSPVGAMLLNHSSSPQFSLPSSTVKPVNQQTSVSSTRFDVNHVLSPQSIARSPFLLSSPSTQTPPEKQYSSGLSSLPIKESQKFKAPMESPCQEPQNSKDAVDRLMEVIKAVSSKTMDSFSTHINSIDSIPPYLPSNRIGPFTQDEVNNMVKNDTEVHPKMSRELSVSLVHHDQCASEVCDIYSTEIAINKRPKTENTRIIWEEIKEINRKLLETSVELVLDEEKINILQDQGTIVKCLFKNVCFPELRGPQGGIVSDKMPEFVILLLVPVDYPASSPTIHNFGHDNLMEPWEKLYKEISSRFDLSLRGVPGKMSLGDVVQKWDANVRAVITEFVEEKGGKSFSSTYGSWKKFA